MKRFSFSSLLPAALLLIVGLVWMSRSVELPWQSKSAPSHGEGRTHALPITSRSGQPLQDYSPTGLSHRSYRVARPTSTQETAALIRFAADEQLPLRVRGRGHSKNHSSLPRAGELLLQTDRLNQYYFPGNGTLRVGSGPSLQAINRLLADYGYQLPVFNDGVDGPSVGGYVAAGGISRNGGFWDHVEELVVVDGTGRIRILRPGDEAFLWLFGSMGQLGVVTEATLRIVPLNHSHHYPQGTGGILDDHFQPQAPQEHGSNRLFWFSLFVPADEVSRGLAHLESLQRDHMGLLAYRPPYRFPIPHIGGHPPLIYPENRDLVALGLWGRVPPAADVKDVYVLERGFMRLVQEVPGYRRYVQSELVPADMDYEAYFGPEIFAQFRRWKDELDPLHILNSGDVFPAQHGN